MVPLPKQKGLDKIATVPAEALKLGKPQWNPGVWGTLTLNSQKVLGFRVLRLGSHSSYASKLNSDLSPTDKKITLTSTQVPACSLLRPLRIGFRV